MKTFKIILLGICIYAHTGLTFAGNALKFGKIPDEIVLKKVYDKDDEAEAVVLSHTGSTKLTYQNNVGFMLIYEIHKVVKIFTKEGVGHADLEIPYYKFPGRTDNVVNIKGYIYNEFNGEIVKEKLEKSHVFDEAQTKTYHIKKISPPNVKEGTVVEISYEINSDLVSYVREWEFQSDIPTEWSEFYFEYPDYYTYAQSSQGYVKYAINEQKTGSGRANWSDIDRTTQGFTTTSSFSNNSVSYSTKQYRWAVENAPALKPEPYVDNPRSYVTKLEFQLQYVQFPNSQRRDVTGTWQKMSEDLLNDEDFGKHLQKSKFTREILESLAENFNSEEDKIIALTNYVSHKVKWDGTSGLYPRKSLDKVFKEGKGSVSEINILLILLLREAGLEAHPVVSGTRDRGFLNPSYPIMYKLNYLTVLVKYGENEILVDATEQALPIGFLPLRALNYQGWAVIPQASKWVEMSNSKPNSETTLVHVRFMDENVLVNVQKNNHGYQSASIKSKIFNEGEEKYKESFLVEMENWELIDFSIDNVDSKEKPIVQKYEIKGSEGMVHAGDVIYYSPFEDFQYSDNPFKLEGRVFPIDFIYPQKRQVVMTIDVPEGYRIEELPKSEVLHFNDKGLVYSCKIMAQGDSRIQVMLSYQVNQTLHKASDYTNIREFYDLIARKQKESFVFKRL